MHGLVVLLVEDQEGPFQVLQGQAEAQSAQVEAQRAPLHVLVGLQRKLPWPCWVARVL